MPPLLGRFVVRKGHMPDHPRRKWMCVSASARATYGCARTTCKAVKGGRISMAKPVPLDSERDNVTVDINTRVLSRLLRLFINS
jgi:hypothetical protein